MTTAASALPIEDLPAESLPRLSRYRVAALLSCNAWEPSKAGSPDFQFGKAFHSAIELALHVETSVEDLVEVGIAATPGFPIERREELQRLVDSYVGWLDRSELLQWNTQTEVQLERTADGVAILSGIADRVDVSLDRRTVRIVDLKTQWLGIQEKRPPFQLIWYAALASRRHLAAERFLLELHAVRTLEVHAWTVELGFVEDWWEQITARLAQVLAAPKQPSGGEACAFCAKRYECPMAVPEAAHLPESDDQASEIAQDYVRLKAGLELREKALRTYLKDREPLNLAGHVFGYKPSAPSVKLLDKDRALEEGIATETRPSLRFSVTKAKS